MTPAVGTTATCAICRTPIKRVEPLTDQASWGHQSPRRSDSHRAQPAKEADRA